MASVFRRFVRYKDEFTGKYVKTTKKRDVWDFRYKDAQGNWKQGVGWPDKKRTKEHALALEAECRAIRKGEKDAPRDTSRRNTPITDVVREWLDWGRAQGGRGGLPWDPATATARKTHVEWWISTLGLENLSAVDLSRVEKGIRELMQTKANKTVKHYMTDLRSLLNWSVRRGYLRENPLAGMAKIDDTPKVPHRLLTDEELAALLSVAPPDRLLWYDTALASGFRVGELRSVRVRDLDMFGPSLYLRAGDSKDRKEARQPIPKSIAGRLHPLTDGRGLDEPLLGIPSGGSESEQISSDYQKAGVKILTPEGKATWHSLRKCFINALVKSRLDLKTIMTLARHSSAQMSMEVYAKPDPALLRDGVEAAFDRAKNGSSWGKDGAKLISQENGGPITLDDDED